MLRARVQLPSGVWRHMISHAALVRSPIDGRDRLVGTVRDVSDLAEMEERLRHLARMEAVGRLAAGIAHDFNNYLTVITANLTVLGGDDTQDVVAQIEHATTQALQPLQRSRSTLMPQR